MLYKYNFISKEECVSIISNCDANAVTKFKKKHPGETILSFTKEESIWTIISNGVTWTLNVPSAKKGTCREMKKAMKRLKKAIKERERIDSIFDHETSF